MSATSITPNSAVLNGSVNPNGLQTSLWFEFGTSSTLSGCSSSPYQNAGKEKILAEFSQSVINLSTKKTYYYRIVATSDTINSRGEILNFTTLAPYNNLNGEWTLSTTSFSNINFTATLSANLSLTQTNELLTGYTQDVYKIAGTFNNVECHIQRKSNLENYLYPYGSGNIVNAGVNITIQSHNLEFDLASSNFHFNGVSTLFDTMTGDLSVKINMTTIFGTADGVITLTGMWTANRK
jgi:hypothetical protein